METIQGDFNHIASVTGVTAIKKQTLLNRVGGSSKYELSPQVTIIKKTVKKANPTEPTTTKKEPRERKYQLNKKEIRQRLLLFIRTKAAKNRCYFWTITFPESLPDYLAYQAFNIFLTRLRTTLNLKSYLWVAERQENGTIHYHMVIHQYINVQKANRYMRASLMTMNKKKITDIPPKSIKNYNGVDIAKNRKTKRVINFAHKKRQKALHCYLTKYISKNDHSYSNYCWHCSRDYSIICTKVRMTYQEFKDSPLYHVSNTQKPFYSEHFIFYHYFGNTPEWLIDFLTVINDAIHIYDEKITREKQLEIPPRQNQRPG